MAQSDQVVQNATFPSVRTDINDNLAALFSQSSGSAAPTTTVAFQPWIDTSSSPPVWKVRNAANSGWITIGVLDTTFSVGGLTPIANGGTGATTAATALAALLPSQAGNSGKALTTNGTDASWNTLSTLTLETAKASTSGTFVDFTDIPSWVKRITVMFNGVSSNGNSDYLIQLGDSGGIETTGYLGASSTIATSVSTANYTTGFGHQQENASHVTHGSFVITYFGSNRWICHGVCGRSNSAITVTTAGNKTLSDTLTQVRITTVGGVNTFDAGSINLMLEG